MSDFVITEEANELITLTIGVSEARVEDLVAALLTAGTSITLSYDADAGTLTISAEVEAGDVEADTASFDGKLSATDDTVQKALDTLDDITTFSLVVDTKDNILATSPSVNVLAFATDTDEFYLYDGSDWRVAPLELQVEDAAPDMGAYVAGGLGTSDKMGYYSDAITDKTLHNIVLKGNSREVVGGLRIDTTQDPDTFEIYLRNEWQDILYDLTAEDGDFRHTPLTEEIYIWRGDSVSVGLNGRPITSEYQTSMGAYPPARQLNGGTF